MNIPVNKMKGHELVLDVGPNILVQISLIPNFTDVRQLPVILASFSKDSMIIISIYKVFSKYVRPLHRISGKPTLVINYTPYGPYIEYSTVSKCIWF